ncbi:MAG: hypothetical protein K0Q72_5256, partial [Armatimonadetes bacterium]|nr:hypothetical protein [Armatimonadota bacterium]
STTNEIVLGKAKKRSVKLRFQPEALGTVTSAWEILSDDPARPLVTVPLQGAAPGIR